MDELEAGLLTECCELLNTISTYPENKKCFDCADNHSPRYLCTTFSTFVCSCCANIHQEFGHKIKVLSIFSFTVNEIYVLKETGNRVAADKWLARWRPDIFNEPNPTSPTYKEDAREYIRLKYIEKQWVKVRPPVPLGEVVPRSKGAFVSPRKLPETPGSRDTTGVSPRGIAGVSPRGTADVSPRGVADVSPRGVADVSPHGFADVSPRGVADVSPRGTDVPPFSLDVDMLQEDDAVVVPQHDAEKSMSHPSIRDTSLQPPPIVYQYVPQPVYIPMSISPAQYGYPQYPVPLDLNQYPQYYSRRSGDFQPLLYSYPFDNSRVTPIFADDAARPGNMRREMIVQPSQSCRNVRSQSLPDDVSPGILRSISDISLATAAIQVPPQAPSQVSKGGCTSNCKCSSCSAQNTNKVDTKLKIQGLMSKVTGLLGPKK